MKRCFQVHFVLAVLDSYIKETLQSVHSFHIHRQSDQFSPLAPMDIKEIMERYLRK